MGFDTSSQQQQSTGSTGATTSLSFVPALLANEFLGTGIGVSEGGFQILGGDENLEGLFTQPQNFMDRFAWAASDQTGKQLGLTSQQQLEAPIDPLTGLGGTPSGPSSLTSNLRDLLDPNINPAIADALKGLGISEQGADLANQLLTGSISSTLEEGLETGFKPDLQPIIDEAQRGFFQDIVPQLGQQNVALQEGVGPFSTDLSGQLLQAGGDIQSQLGSLETGLQERAGDRRSNLLGISNLFTDQLFNANTDASRNRLALGEQLAQLGTTGGRQASALAVLAGLLPSNPLTAQSQQSTGSGSSFGLQTSGGGGAAK